MEKFYLAHIDKKRCLSWSVDSAPCQDACPLGIDVEGYISAIAKGNLTRALEIIREKCPLPSVCGRVCHHPCESICKRGEVDEPLAIEALKRFVTDHASPQDPEPTDRIRSEKVAIIGAGPAGLTAAHDLIKLGYRVCIYEALGLPGGMLAFGISEFKLPQEIVQKEIEYIKALGVEIKLNTRLGKDITLSDLKQQGYQAILIAIGAEKSLPLPISGSDLKGVIDALPFLQNVRLGERALIGGKVAVIGGGNVAIDSARTCIRLGCEEVTIVYRRSRQEMPATEEEILRAEEEGVKFLYLTIPTEIMGTDGKVTSLHCVSAELGPEDKDGRRTPVPVEGSEFQMEVDAVIPAIGQVVDHNSVLALEDLQWSRRSTVVVDPDTLGTNVAGVFAAGDVVVGPGTVTESMAAGRKAAESIVRYLEGHDLKTDISGEKETVHTGIDIVPEELPRTKRQGMRLLSREDQLSSFKEVELGFTEEQAVEEAKRCLRCKTCLRCIEETQCVALSPVDHKFKNAPRVSGILCAGCGRCTVACSYGNIHLTELE